MSDIDTDAMFQEAVNLRDRVEKLELLGQEFVRYSRDEELHLLSNGFLPDADPEVRIAAVRLRANQIVQEAHPELYRTLDEERAKVNGLRISNEAIVAVGWADNFANAYWRKWAITETDAGKGELEA